MTDSTTDWLRTHTDALRRLASHLLQDPNEVDDALQECYVQALRSPPREREGAQAWLEAVLRNVIRRRSRGAKRRLVREAERARPELQASTIDIVSRQQSLETLTAALAALPGREKEAIFLRYFDGLPAREISRRLRRPIEEIYRDLERGRARLRQKLERDRHDWRAGLATLIGLCQPVTVVPYQPGQALAKGLTTMLIKKKLVYLMGAVAVIVASTIYWPEEPSLEANGPSQATSGKTSPGLRTASLETSSDPKTRHKVPQRGTDENSQSPYVYELAVTLRTNEDLPGRYGHVLLAPRDHPLNLTQVDRNGHRLIKWRGRTPTMEIVYTTPRAKLGRGRLQLLQLTAGVKSAIILRTRAMFRQAEEEEMAFSDITSTLYNKCVAYPTLRLTTDMQGFSIFSIRDAVLEEQEEEPIVMDEEVTVTISRPEAKKGNVEGRVLDRAGEPLSRVLVFACRELDQPQGIRTFTNSSGAFRLVGMEPGHYFVRAGGGDHGIARMDFDMIEGAKQLWDPMLDRGLEYKAILLDADEKPLAHWQVEFTNSANTQIDGTETDSSGHFAIPNLAAESYRGDFYPPHAAIPAWSTGELWPQGNQVILHTPRSAEMRGKLIVAPTLGGSRDWAFGPVIVFASSRFAVRKDFPSPKGFAFRQLPVGDYLVQTLGNGLGYDSPSRVTVTLDQAVVHAPERGKPTTLSPDIEAKDLAPQDLWYLHRNLVSRVGPIVATTYLIPGTYQWQIDGVTEEIELSPLNPRIQLGSSQAMSK